MLVKLYFTLSYIDPSISAAFYSSMLAFSISISHHDTMYRHNNFAANDMGDKQHSTNKGLGRYKYVPLILSILSILTLLVCISTDFWYLVDISSKKQANEGLWRHCILGKCKGYRGGKNDFANPFSLCGCCISIYLKKKL